MNSIIIKSVQFLTLSCISIGFLSSQLVAQQSQQIKTIKNQSLIRCATTQKLQEVRDKDPYYDQRNAKNEQIIQNWINNNYNSSQSKKAVITIPTVVQLWVNSSTVSDARVQEQIDVLNEDYRRLNADASNTPSAFQGVAADCEIEFCLATKDPNGNSTNGIIRKTVGGSPGASDNWDHLKYLNIYVYSLSGGVLGYTYTPGNAPNGYDAVNIDYHYFGSTGASSPYNKGRTTTHEVGHWLNLEHVWGSGGGGCSQDDFVSDTPMQSSEYYFCPSHPQSSCSSDDMFMNFMDYVNDNCMNTFTAGQKSRMVSAINNLRPGILTSDGCGSTTSNTLDASVSGIISPTGTGCVTTITPVVTIQNIGLNTLTSVTINYDVDNGANNTYSWTGSLSTNATTNVTLPSMTVSAGIHTFNCSTSSPNGSTDQDASNDAAAQSFTISGAGSGSPLPFTEGFESSTFAPNGWTLENPDNNATWERVTTTSGNGNSSACAKMNFYSGNENISGQSDYLLTPELDLTGVSSPLTLEFDLAYCRYGQNNYDSLIVWGSTDCGASWTRLWQEGDTQLATAADNTQEWTAGANDWKSVSINLNSFIGNGVFQVRFHAYSFWGNNLFIDDINLSGATSSTPPVADFTSTSTTICAGETVSFTDQSTNSPSTWAWSFQGGSPSSSSSQNQTVTYNNAGTYNVTLVVSNGGGSDTKTSNSYITVEAAPTANASSTDASCNSICDGTASISASGGSTPYTYFWDSNPSQNTATATGLCAGTYNYSVASTNGCTATGSVTISEPNAISLNLTSSDASCGAADGSATATATGGSTPYTYSWDDPANQNTATATGLSAGIYAVTITDASGCTTSSSVSVNNQGAPSISTSIQDNLCNGESHGQATVTPTGGTSPYSYNWNTTPPQNASTATGLAAGTYSIIVTDANGCIVSDFATISEPSAINLNMAYTNVSSSSACDGIASVTATGGTPPFMYLWDDSTSQVTSSASNLCIGNYNVIVTDANGCISNGSVYVDSLVMGIQKPTLGDLLSIYPNPTSGDITITLSGNNDEKITLIEIYDLRGQLVHELSIHNGHGNRYSIDLSRQPAGMYFVRIVAQDKMVSKKITLIR